jgi:hypothetical protein
MRFDKKLNCLVVIFLFMLLISLSYINAENNSKKIIITPEKNSNKNNNPITPFNEIWKEISKIKEQIKSLSSSIKDLQEQIKNIRSLETMYVPGEKIEKDQYWPNELNEGLQGYWNMDEGTGLITKDTTEQNPPGTLNSGVSWSKDCKIGNCTFYNGVNGLTNLSSAITTTESTPLSVSFWIKSNKIQNNAIVSMADNDPQYFNGFQIFDGAIDGSCFGQAYNHGINPKLYAQGGYISNGINVNVLKQFDSDCTKAIDINSWYHIVVTYNGNKSSSGIEVYMDGVKIAPAFGHSDPSASGLTGTYTKNLLALGGVADGSTGWNFNGNIDEFAIWNRTLTSDEVSQLYNDGNGLSYPKKSDFYYKACCSEDWVRTGCTGNSSKTIKPTDPECCESLNSELWAICLK